MTSHFAAPKKALLAPRLAAAIAAAVIVVAGTPATPGAMAARFSRLPAPAIATPPDTTLWARLDPTGGPPFARAGHTAVYDPLRNRMIVFGGYGGAYINDTWVLSLDGDPTWTKLMPSGEWPSARTAHSAIYDPVRDRMLIFGGNDNSLSPYKNDVWELSLAGVPTWTQLQPTGGPISPRAQHSAIYDPVRDRMIVFGGFDGYFPNGEVWALSLSGTMAWTLLSPSSNAPYYSMWHRAVYNPVRDAMIVFGGMDAGHVIHNDVSVLPLAGFPTWSSLTPDGPPPQARVGHAMVYDSRHDRILIYGGSSGGVTLGDSWALYTADPARWVSPVMAGAEPPLRTAHSAIFFPDSARMVLFGGNGRGGPAPTSETWTAQWCLECLPGGVELIPPRKLYLEPAGANPFRSQTAFLMGVSQGGRARLRVFDQAGRLVATLVDRDEQPGWREIPWNARNGRGTLVPSGVYLARLESGGQERVRKVVVSR